METKNSYLNVSIDDKPIFEIYEKQIKKTLWQKIYSSLGFWFYNEITDNGTYKVIYWCCLPYGKFFRKFDLFKVKISNDMKF